MIGLRRHLLAVVCIAVGMSLFAICAVIVIDYIMLADGEAFIGRFVQQAIADGPAMRLPDVPAAADRDEQDMRNAALQRAHAIGPLVSLQPADCTLDTSAQNLCAGQLLACLVKGTGQRGTFQTYVAMCRNGNFSHYRFAKSGWTFNFRSGEPLGTRADDPI